VLVGKDKVYSAPPIARAPALLTDLLGLYWQGLTRPLKFFPRSSLAYAEAVLAQAAEGAQREPLSAARASWAGNPFTGAPGESDDAYFEVAFRGQEPLDEDFATTAQEVFGPLLAELQEVEP
jgi:exodeoxyribonuclease V gamma subunit